MTVALMEERLPYIRFETRAIEDRAETEKQGRYVAKDVDFVVIQPAGSKDTIEKRADEWLAANSRTLHAKRYQDMYDHWKRGEEIPVDGHALKLWPAISPAVCTNLISCNIRTVEELANANEATLQRIGMGARALKQQAQAWLASANDIGKVAAENASLKAQLATNAARLTELEATVEAMRKNKEPAPKARKNQPAESEE